MSLKAAARISRILVLDGRTHSRYLGVSAASVSADGRDLAAMSSGLIFYDVLDPPDQLTSDLVQHYPARGGSCIPEDQVLVLFDQGRRKSLTRPIDILEPTSGDTTPTGVVLDDHPAVDSAL